MGKERASGPKGIAFLTLPGLDLQTLKKKNVSIGEWPDASEAELTPFMKVMISRSKKGRALVKIVDRLNIQDLSKASDNQITAVKDLVWEIKRLFYALISRKSSDVLDTLDIGGGAKLSANLAADLTAAISRDVVLSAQEQWLPNLAREITIGPTTAVKQPIATEQDQNSSSAVSQEGPSGDDAPQAPAAPAQQTEAGKAPNKAKRDPPACLMRVFGQCLMSSGPDENAEAAQPEESASEADTEQIGGQKKKSSAAELSPPMHAGLSDARQIVEQSGSKRTNQSDDLLFPTEKELREIKARNKDARHGGTTDTSAEPRARSGTVAPAPRTGDASIVSEVDPESWAEYGGWYRQDYTIFYRPTGHKDKFIYSWLLLAGPQAPKGDGSPAAEVFDTLTSKDAQGSCTKCHSVDDIPGKGRFVNFSPPSVESKRGRFTNFIHEPHLTIVGTRGCLTCHDPEKNRPYLKSYEHGNPQNFASNFGAVKKNICQSCHTSNAARQDCLTCHKYHVNGVITPIMNAKIPIK
jgi:hypothetical protein